MKRRLLLWIALTLLLPGTGWKAFGFDLSRPPTPGDFAEIQRMGWAAARDELQKAIDKAYRPATLTQPSSSARPAFAAWVDIWRITALLATPEKESLAGFFSKHLFRDSLGKINFRPTGFAAPADATPLSSSEVREIVASSAELRRRLLPQDFVVSDAGILGDRAGMELGKELIANPLLQKEFLNSLSDADCMPLVLEQLRQMREAAPEDFRKLPALAVAIAIVWDSPPPDDWPHHQVHSGEVPKQGMSAVDRFAFWVAAQKEKRLLSDPAALDAATLKFMVDAPVATDELLWAQKNVRQSKGSFDKVFSSIRYDRGRVAAAQFDWPHGPYTLEAIQKQGGICVDQAYFAMIAGKARGLPTLFFTGQGRDGGHAWFGYLKSENRWEMDCGRYENQNYSVGEAVDPQTWMPVTDHDLARMAGTARRVGDLAVARRDLALASGYRRQNESAKALAACDSALRTAPDVWEVWELKAELLREAPAGEQKVFWEEAAVKFKNDADILARCQRELVALARAAGDETAAESHEKAIISHNRNARGDLSVAAAAQRLEEAMKAGDFEAADKVHRDALRTLARTGGGDLFYQMTRPLAFHYLERGDATEVRRLLDATRRALKPQAGSILDQELGLLEEKARALK